VRLPITLKIVDRTTGSEVTARIRRTIFPDILQWRAWIYASDAEDRDWDWLAIFAEAIKYPRRFECYSLIVESDLHCLIRLDLRGRLLRGSRWLIIEYLSTNPVDRNKNAGMKYLGESMMAVATERSLAHNLKGRIWLESLPRAEEFYDNLGFERLKRRSKDGYKTYTLDADTAVQLLTAIRKRRGWKDAKEV
jgi:hypothetical protein